MALIAEHVSASALSRANGLLHIRALTPQALPDRAIDAPLSPT